MNEIATTLHTLLAHNIVSFTFRKINGEIRHAKGTRNLDLARATTNEYIPNPKGEEQPNSYFDVEKMGWRSYKPENLISIDEVVNMKGRFIATKKGELPKREIPISKTMGADTDNAPTTKEEPINFDLGKVAKMLGMPNGTPFVKGEFGMGMPIGESFTLPTENGGGMVFTPLLVNKETTTLPISEMSIEDFAKLVAHYVVEELVTRIAR